MATEHEKVKDPVCGMRVLPDQNALVYEEMHFAFCSQQCKERFQANPYLYIGVPSEQSPKQAGQKLLKRRLMHLERPLSAADGQLIREHLLEMMGVRSVDVEEKKLTITY